MENQKDILIVGRGVAGIAAAWGAARRGAIVQVVGDQPGGTVLGSGALDWAFWADEREVDKVPLVGEFFRCAGRWVISEQKGQVATLSGQLRPTSGHDARVLNLATLPRGAVVGVPAFPRGNWDGNALAKSWSAQPWARERNVSFEAFGIGPWRSSWNELPTEDLALARLFDDDAFAQEFGQRLAVESYDALLTGPWLGVDKDASSLLRNQFGLAVGETISGVGGPAGDRWEAFVRQLGQANGIAVSRGRLLRFQEEQDGVRVWLEAGESKLVGALVLAVGRLVGGGVRWVGEDPDEASVAKAGVVQPSFDGDACLVIGGQKCPSPGSLFGSDLDHMLWPSSPRQSWPLEDIHFGQVGQRLVDSRQRPYQRVFVAGAAAQEGRVGMLAGAASGLITASAVCDSLRIG